MLFNKRITKVSIFKISILLLASQLALASNIKNTKENYKSIIKKARNLSLQHERVQACQLLKSAIQQYPNNKIANTELVKNLKLLSEFFYTDKGLQFFELAKTSSANNPSDALDLLSDADKLEKENVKISNLSALIHLQQSKCEKALISAEKSLSLNPYSEEAQTIKLQSLSCLNDIEKFNEFEKQLDLNWKNKSPYYLNIKLKFTLQSKDLKNINSLLVQLNNIAKDFPDYYLRLSEKPGEEKNIKNLINYVQSCKDIDKIRKKYEYEPQLCFSVEEVNKKIKNLENQEVN